MNISTKIAALVLGGLLTQFASAADVGKVKQSKWNAVYQDDDGTFVVNNTLVLDGTKGSYTTESGQVGKLYNIRYAYLTAGSNRKVGVYGEWKLGNQKGAFTFRVQPSGKKFAGQWSGANNQAGTWSGNWRKWDDEEEEQDPTPVDPTPIDPDDAGDGEDPGPVPAPAPIEP